MAASKTAPDNKSPETQREQPRQHGKMREYFESLIVAIILALIVKTFVVQTFQIPSGSMEDGLLVGDHIIVNKTVFGPDGMMPLPFLPIRDIRRGDIVIFKWPPNPRIDYIKRVIGLPGETVRIHRHQVWIDGKRIEELGLDEDRYTLEWRHADRERAEAIGSEYVYDPALDTAAEQPLEFHVPEGHYFMLGDHRYVSQDSRFWGTVPRANITGRAVLIYWSFKAEREHYQETNFGNQVGNMFNAVLSFPFKTRWERLFRIIS
jgi:signal peptidase I